jgi:sec-independent protein translocase protein TatB
MFDVGFTEVLLLAIISLLVLGPERLPRVARTLGGLTRKARSSWLNLKRSIEAEINAEEIKKPIQKMHSEVRSAVDGVDKQLKKAADAANTTVGSIGGSSMASLAAGQAAKPEGTEADAGAAKASPDDPQ